MTQKAPGHHLFYKGKPELAGAKLNTAPPCEVQNLAGLLEMKIAKKMCYCLLALFFLSGMHSLLRVGCIACKDRVCYHYLTGAKESRKGLLCDRGSLKCV